MHLLKMSLKNYRHLNQVFLLVKVTLTVMEHKTILKFLNCINVPLTFQQPVFQGNIFHKHYKVHGHTPLFTKNFISRGWSIYCM